MATETKYEGEFPDPNIDPNKKGKKFILDFGKAMFSSFKRSGGSMFFNQRAQYLNLMAFAQGNQSVDQYKQLLDCWEDQDNSWMNLDWQVLNLASRFVNVVQGKLNKTESNVVATAIDVLAMDQKREFQAKVKAMLQLQGWMKTIGVDSSKFFADMPDVSMDPDELAINLNINIKHRWCMQMEKIINSILDNNDYKELKNEFIYYLIVLGVAALKITEKRDGLPKLELVNPGNLIVSHSEFPNFRGLEYAGEVKPMTPTEFFKRAGNSFTEEEKKDILKRYAKVKSGGTSTQNNEVYSSGSGRMIEVLDFTFLSPDMMVHEKKNDKRGNSRLYRKNFNYPSNQEEYGKKYEGEREVINSSYDAAYRGLWIVGSDYICDYGRVENSTTDGCYDNVIPYVILAPNMKNGKTVSLVQQMIPVLNSIQINWYRYNDTIAKYIPKGSALDLDALEDIAIGKGGTKMTKREIIDLYQKKGILVYRRNTMANKGSHGLPIEELENGMSKDMVNFFNNILNGLSILRQILGVNEVTDASTPDPKMLKSLADAAMAGTNNALDYLYHGLDMSFEYLCQNLSYSTLAAIGRGVETGIDESVGFGTVKFFGENSDITKHKYSIKIENKPAQEEWASFYQNEVAIALNNGQILPSDAAFVREIDNLKEARQYLIVRERKKAQMDAQQQQASIQATAQAQQQSAALSTQLKMQEISAEVGGKSEVEKQKIAGAIALELEKRKTLELQYDLELRNAQALSEINGSIKSAQIAQEATHHLIHESVVIKKEAKKQA